jgi:LysM repeat protein
MSRVVELLRSRRVPQVAVLALMSVGFAGCSADMQTRFRKILFQSLCLAARSHRLGADARRSSAASCRNIPGRNRSINPVGPCRRRSHRAAVLSGREQRRVGRRARAFASYAPPAQPPLETTGTVAPRSVAATRARPRRAAPRSSSAPATRSTSWRALQRFARRDPAGQWLQGTARAVARPAADHSAPDRCRRAAPAVAPPASKPVAAGAPSSVHIVNRGDTLLSIARRNHVPVAELAKANNLDPSAKLKLGMKLTVPGAKTAAVAPAAQPAPAPAQPVAAVLPPATKMAAAGGAAAKRAAGAGDHEVEEKPLRRSAGESPAKPPARCRPSAGRCAAR